MKVLVATEKAFAPVAINQIKLVTEAAGYELVLLENYKNNSDLIRCCCGC
jgi:D-3-phosphoglycerate dehydrogenase